MENKRRILVVDDNIINLATIEQELKGRYDVITVNSGSRALRFLNQEKPDLVLLDVQMALMDGIETLKEIRAMENGSAVPVIMLTAKKDRETVLEGTRLGILDYILKPFDSQDLHARIDKALKRAGVIPVEERELYESIREVETDLQSGNNKGALTKIDEILSFKIDEEVFGRMQGIKSKLRMGDDVNAQRLVARLLKMMEKSVALEAASRTPISSGEINARLIYVLEDLKNFKVKEAAAKLEDLMQYDVPSTISKACERAQDCLDEFDDESAEQILQNTLAELKNYMI